MATVEVRDGIVRRSTGFWSPAVHVLLRHLESVGFDRAPTLLGVDPHGAERLSFLPGDVRSSRNWDGDDNTVRHASRLLRDYHDATAALAEREITGWDPFFRESVRGEVICHNDFGVNNCVFRNGQPAAMIDFDCAAPGSRVWDLAWTAIAFVPFDPAMPSDDRPRRLRLLCDAYGLEQPRTIVDAMEARLMRLRQGLPRAAGTSAPQAAAPESHLRFTLGALRLVRRLRPQLLAALR